MKALLASVLAAGTMFLSSPVRADYFDGNRLLSACQVGPTDPGLSLCLGFLAGINDLVVMLEHEHILHGYCPPENATLGQMSLIVQKWYRDHPADLSNSASADVVTALQQAFPCAAQK
jgi:hypothetical protein